MSRFFLGSNKVMQVALGRSASDEIRSGIYKVSKVVYSASYNGCFMLNGPFFQLDLHMLWYVVSAD